MERYPNISDHGVIGDLQTAALVSTDGNIDWFCTPRFDAPSVFASLLDADKGGHFHIWPTDCEYVTRQMYLPDSGILVTRFMSADGVGEVHDFMPVITGRATDRHRVVRQILVNRGTMHFEMDLQPRFDYARRSHEVEVSDGGAVFRSDGQELTLHTVGARSDPATQLKRRGKGLRAGWTLREGQRAGVVLESSGGQPRRMSPGEVERLARDTLGFWRGWLGQCTYRGRWREMVTSSAMALKMMTYAPTGAMVAAPTAGLPEQIGGERNWDYRYTWIRDASFSVYSLLGLGYREEAARFGTWMRDRVTEQAGNGSGPLKIMYRVDGSSDLTEETLSHLEGWRGSRPVRIGNGAANQLQLDIYGEAFDALLHADDAGLTMAHQGWLAVAEMTDWVCEHWDQPDEGIWETRGGRKDFTYGRFQSWVALDRAIRLAERHGRPADIVHWRTERDQVYQQIMARGFDQKTGAFTQYYGTDVLDSSMLLMPLMGFIAPRDPLWLSTMEAMNRELVSDSLVYRYNPSASPDGLKGQEGTFSLCTFWYVDALARAGQLEDAQLTFEKMHTYANHLRLYSEEIGVTGEQLGNFPQAFSHLSLINAAINLDYQLDHGAGSVSGILTRSG
jgi:GH15 family glucan-1,4-alpha-glucosidase